MASQKIVSKSWLRRRLSTASAIGLFATIPALSLTIATADELLRGPLDVEGEQIAVVEEAQSVTDPTSTDGDKEPSEADATQSGAEELNEALETAESDSDAAQEPAESNGEQELADSVAEQADPGEATSEKIEVTLDGDAVQKGRQVADAANANDSGWIDSVAELKMILKNSRGRESRRVMVVKLLEGEEPEVSSEIEEMAVIQVSEDAFEPQFEDAKKDEKKDEKKSRGRVEGDRSLVVFLDPADITGTALLSFNNVERADDQWLYLPSVRKTRRIAASKRNGSFVASEFTYEDMVPSEVDEFTYRYIGEEPCGDAESCHRVERVPVDKDAGYKRQEVLWDTEEFRPYQIEYFNKRDELEKTLASSDFRLYKEKFWRPHYQEMKNHQTGKSTELYLNNIEFETGLKKRDFNAQRLDKVQ